MYRWGDKESHSYVLGVFTKKCAAIKVAKEEQKARGRIKYQPEILEVVQNITCYKAKKFKVVVDLPD